MSDIRKATSGDPVRGVVYDFSRARGRAAAAEPQPVEDRAGFTESARELARAREVVESAADVRAEKVRALKHQVEQGTYKPDAREVAKRLMEKGF